MRKEIVLPPHLYDRIKASAGEHGGIGGFRLFSNVIDGTPHCAHGHAWGTCTRFDKSLLGRGGYLDEPELAPYLTWRENDKLLKAAGILGRERISFAQWCILLNVRRGKDEDFIIPRAAEEMAAAL